MTCQSTWGRTQFLQTTTSKEADQAGWQSIRHSASCLRQPVIWPLRLWQTDGQTKGVLGLLWYFKKLKTKFGINAGIYSVCENHILTFKFRNFVLTQGFFHNFQNMKVKMWLSQTLWCHVTLLEMSIRISVLDYFEFLRILGTIYFLHQFTYLILRIKSRQLENDIEITWLCNQ